MTELKEHLMNITAVVNPGLATTAPQNLEEENSSPFHSDTLLAYYRKVQRANQGTKVIRVNLSRAIKIGYGNDKKAFYTPIAEGHIFFRSITEGIIPVDKVLPPYLPEQDAFKRRTAYGTFSYKTEMTIPQGGELYMVKRGDIYYWVDYLKGRRPGAFQLFWAAAPENNFAGLSKEL